jgi:hypothetical protein
MVGTMSYHRRQTRIAQEHEYYEAPSGNEMALTKEDLEFNYEPGYPGPREIRVVDAANSQTFAFAPYNHDNVQWDVGGVAGDTKFVGSTGVTDPQTVDRHDFAGQMAVVRRMPETNYGPVKTSDHNSMLALLYKMQESSHYFPNEISQADVIRSV